jgi:hypothetical protein
VRSILLALFQVALIAAVARAESVLVDPGQQPAVTEERSGASVEQPAATDERLDASVEQPNLVKQANAPVSTILQLRIQDTYLPEFDKLHGDGNVTSIAVTMPLPQYRLLPIRQLSLLAAPVAVTTPDDTTHFGDLQFTDLGIMETDRGFIWGAGASFVFPSASSHETGQGKWQAGPAAVAAYAPRNWLLGLLLQNPISFAGDGDRKDANALLVRPFLTLQLGKGWFVRSQPVIFIDWENHGEVVPIDLGFGRVFQIGSQYVNLFVEPFWNAVDYGPAPKYGITVGLSLLYPNFWGTSHARVASGEGTDHGR